VITRATVDVVGETVAVDVEQIVPDVLVLAIADVAPLEVAGIGGTTSASA
jgi:hypothetical protein